MMWSSVRLGLVRQAVYSRQSHRPLSLSYKGTKQVELIMSTRIKQHTAARKMREKRHEQIRIDRDRRINERLDSALTELGIDRAVLRATTASSSDHLPPSGSADSKNKTVAEFPLKPQPSIVSSTTSYQIDGESNSYTRTDLRNLSSEDRMVDAEGLDQLLSHVNSSNSNVVGDTKTREPTKEPIEVARQQAVKDMAQRRVLHFEHFGEANAVDEVELLNPGQAYIPRKDLPRDDHYQAQLTGDFESLKNFGRVVPEMPVSKLRCTGCAASLHCRDVSLPGFVPMEQFLAIHSDEDDSRSSKRLCRRCHMLHTYNCLLNVNVCTAEYESMMRRLKFTEQAILVLIVDLLDMPNCIYSQLPQLISLGLERKRLIVVGNKVDLIPPDARVGYLDRITEALRQCISALRFDEQFNIVDYVLVSATTGFGVEHLITRLYENVGNSGDVYLIGCTNVGKSSLFNALIQSDLCNAEASRGMTPATASIWPGTTINMLKFPISKPKRERMVERAQRLNASESASIDENNHLRTVIYNIKVGSKSTMKQFVNRTNPDAGEPTSDDTPVDMDELEQRIATRLQWCYDTPGTVCTDSVLDVFTLDELINVIPRRVLQPRTVHLSAGQALLIGGVARVELGVHRSTKDKHTVEAVPETMTRSGRHDQDYSIPTNVSSHRALVTVFVSGQLPLHVVPISQVDQYYKTHRHTGELVVPSGDEQRLALFPKLSHRTLYVEGIGLYESLSDITLSSIGWLSISTDHNHTAAVRVYTPDGRVTLSCIFTSSGIIKRPCLLPYAVSLRGSRIPGSKLHQIRPIRIPREWQKQKQMKDRARSKEPYAIKNYI